MTWVISGRDVTRGVIAPLIRTSKRKEVVITSPESVVQGVMPCLRVRPANKVGGLGFECYVFGGISVLRGDVGWGGVCKKMLSIVS